MLNETIGPKTLKSLWIVAVLAVVAMVSGCATYGAYDSYQSGRYVYADVIDYQPVYGDVRVSDPKVVCYEETVRHRGRQPSAAAPIFGAIIGGLIGNAIDGGYNRAAGTFIGAVAGGAIAHDIDRSNSGPGGTVVQERCDEYDEYRYERGVTGYEVIYDYQGHTGTLHTDYEPDDVVRVPYHLVSRLDGPAGEY